jgi:hypothetical protein
MEENKGKDEGKIKGVISKENADKQLELLADVYLIDLDTKAPTIEKAIRTIRKAIMIGLVEIKEEEDKIGPTIAVYQHFKTPIKSEDNTSVIKSVKYKEVDARSKTLALTEEENESSLNNAWRLLGILSGEGKELFEGTKVRGTDYIVAESVALLFLA